MRDHFLLRRDLMLAHWAAAAVVVHIIEATLPAAGPWFKPGLANIFTIVAFFQLGFRAAIAVTMIRIVVASLVLGTFLSPTFLLSFSGAAAALLIIGTAVPLKPHLGPVGFSVLAALAHMGGQVVVAAYVIIGHSGLLMILPWVLTISWITGLFNGLAAFLILERIKRYDGWRNPSING